MKNSSYYIAPVGVWYSRPWLQTWSRSLGTRNVISDEQRALSNVTSELVHDNIIAVVTSRHNVIYYIKLQKSLSVCPPVCLSVPPPFFSTRPSDRNQIWHTCSGRYGTHSELKKIDPAHPRVNITSYVTSSNVEYVRHLKTTARRSMT